MPLEPLAGQNSSLAPRRNAGPEERRDGRVFPTPSAITRNLKLFPILITALTMAALSGLVVILRTNDFIIHFEEHDHHQPP